MFVFLNRNNKTFLLFLFAIKFLSAVTSLDAFKFPIFLTDLFPRESPYMRNQSWPALPLPSEEQLSYQMMANSVLLGPNVPRYEVLPVLGDFSSA